MRKLSLGQPVSDDDFRRWAEEAFNEIERASYEDSGEGVEAVAAAAGTAIPLVDGTGNAGTADKWSREDHVHPTDTSRASRDNPSFTGSIKLDGYTFAVQASVWTFFYNQDGVGALILGSKTDKANYYRNEAHNFQNSNFSKTFATLGDSGLSLGVPLVANGVAVSGGFKVTPNNLGNIASPFTPNPALGNYQYGTNHGAATWNAPANDCAMDILVTNDASAGAITFSGYTVNSNTGEPLTTTNGHKFIISIRRINGVSTYLIKALQ
jgi:hypothetical protein